MPTIVADAILICNKLDRKGMWKQTLDNGTINTLTRVKIIISDKDNNYGKNTYIVQTWKDVDEDGKPILDTEGKEVYKEVFVASGKKKKFEKKEKKEVDKSKYEETKEDESDDLPF